MIEDARSAAFEELQPGDEKRMFYTRKPWKRVIVMFATFMNLILAVGLFLTVLMGFGIQQETTNVASVSPCVIAQSENRDTCKSTDKPSPAEAAGLKKGDRIVSFDGVSTAKWDTLSDLIRDSGKTVAIVVERGGKDVTLHATIATNQVAKKDSSGAYVQGEYVKAGLPRLQRGHRRRQAGLRRLRDLDDRPRRRRGRLPRRPPRQDPRPVERDLRRRPARARLPDGHRRRRPGHRRDRHAGHPRLAAAGDGRVRGRHFNLSLFLFNMLPLLPLDGGHIAGALWESLRRNLARVLRRPDPGPFDVAKLMPVAYVVAGIFVCFTILVLIADVVNPVRIS